MNLKKVSDNIQMSFGVGKSGSAEDFRKAIGNNPSSEEAYKLIRDLITAQLLESAKTEVSWASGADRPGETVAWGPASKYKEVRSYVGSVEDYLWDDDNYPKIAEALGLPVEDVNEDMDLTPEQEAKISEAFCSNPEGSGEYALCAKDWNDTGDWLFDGLCSAEELVDFLIGGEGNFYGYSECPWGLYQCMLLCGLDPAKFYYQNTNEDCAPLPTTEEVSEELENKIWDLSATDGYGHYYSWSDNWKPDLESTED